MKNARIIQIQRKENLHLNIATGGYRKFSPLFFRLLCFIPFCISLFNCSGMERPPDYYSESYINARANYPEAEELEKQAREHVKKNENREAIQAYTRIIQLYPRYNHLYRIYTGRAIALHKSSEFNPALNDYLKAIKLYPHFVNAWVSLGLLYKHLGNTREAVAAFKQCIKIMPEKKSEFIKLIQGLKPFSRALLSDERLILAYEYGEIRFMLAPSFQFKIETTDNPANPYKITVDNENKIVFHLFVMDFSASPEYRFLPFKERTQRWANLEQSIFYQLSGRQAEAAEIKEIEISGRKCAYIDLKQTEKVYRLVFFYSGKFGIMVMLGTTTEDFNKGLSNIPAVISMIRLSER